MKKGIFFSLLWLIPFFFPSFSFAAWSDHDTGCYFRAPITSTQTANYTHDWYHTESYDFDQMILGDVNQKRTFNSNPSYTLNGGSVTLFFYSTIGGYWQTSPLPSAELDGGAHSQLTGIEEWSGTSTTLNTEYPNGCEDLPEPCEDELAQALSDCSDIEFIVWDNLDTCEYHCLNCDNEYQEAIATCGVSNFTFNNIDCEYACLNCQQEIDAADLLCEFGWYWTEETHCEYECVDDCESAFDICYRMCFLKGGILNYGCLTDGSGNIDDLFCECRDGDGDGEDDEDPDPGTDPDPPEDPPDDPPADDPVDPDDDSEWLEAIKDNTDTLVEQGNDDAERQEEHTALLDNISGNTKIIADNQGVTNDTLKSIGDKIDGLNYDAVEVDLSKLENNTSAIKDSLNVDDDFASTFQNELDSTLASDKATQTSDMQNAIGDILDEYGGVEPDDASFFSSLFISIIPPSTTCQPLDISFKDKEIIIGCEYSAEIKEVMSYFIYILTVLSIFTLVRRELIPKTSA